MSRVIAPSGVVTPVQAVRADRWVPSKRVSFIAAIGKVADADPAGIVTDTGMVASVVSPLRSDTISAASTGPDRVTVPVAAPAPAFSPTAPGETARSRARGGGGVSGGGGISSSKTSRVASAIGGTATANRSSRSAVVVGEVNVSTPMKTDPSAARPSRRRSTTGRSPTGRPTTPPPRPGSGGSA